MENYAFLVFPNERVSFLVNQPIKNVHYSSISIVIGLMLRVKIKEVEQHRRVNNGK